MTEALVFLAAYFLAAFCGGSETAFSAAGRIQVAARGRRSRAALWFMANPSRYLATTLVGTNVGVVLASSITNGWARSAGGAYEALLAFATALFFLVFAETVPKQISLHRSDFIAVNAAGPLRMLRWMLFPLIAVATAISRAVAGPEDDSRFFESREEVKGLLLSSGGESGRKANAVLAMAEIPVGTIALPLDEVPFVSGDSDRAQAVKKLIQTGARFLLVWEKPGITLMGAVDGSDLVRWNGEGPLSRITTGLPYFASSAIPVHVLMEIWRSGAPAAVVLNERGQPGGLITKGLILEHMITDYRNG